MKHRFIAFMCLSLPLTACFAEREPADFDRMAVNATGQLQVESNRVRVGQGRAAQRMVFPPGGADLEYAQARAAADAVNAALGGTAAQAVVYCPGRGALHEARTQALVRWLRGLGIPGAAVSAAADDAQPQDECRVEFAYALVSPPPCPNWSSSPVHSYDNLPFSQMGCAGATNLGAMVMEPYDLVRGSGKVRPDAARSSAVIQAYQSGGAAAAAGGASGTPSTAEASGGAGSPAGSGDSSAGQ